MATERLAAVVKEWQRTAWWRDNKLLPALTSRCDPDVCEILRHRHGFYEPFLKGQDGYYTALCLALEDLGVYYRGADRYKGQWEKMDLMMVEAREKIAVGQVREAEDVENVQAPCGTPVPPLELFHWALERMSWTHTRVVAERPAAAQFELWRMTREMSPEKFLGLYASMFKATQPPKSDEPDWLRAELKRQSEQTPDPRFDRDDIDDL